MSKKIGVVSLGCDKNRVDTENMLSLLVDCGHQICDNPQQADVIIVNTCAFVCAAREEAIDTILQMAEYKKQGNKKLIVTGCLPQKHLEEVRDLLPEVDAFLGTEAYARLPEIINGHQRVCDISRTGQLSMPRLLTTPAHYAYLKIAEGCDNRCTYCTIPSIRGGYKSRDMQSLLQEAQYLSSIGVQELILVAQDITKYGKDFGQKQLVNLIERIAASCDFTWIRLLYCYPEDIDDALIEIVAQHPKVCKYMDIPMQHIDDIVLKKMNRKSDSKSLKSLIEKIRKAGDIAIRSTFIVGFPYETPEAFAHLTQFLQEYKLDFTGFFAFSPEEGTPAFGFDAQVEDTVKQQRLLEVEQLASNIMAQNNKRHIGKIMRVLYEDIDFDCNLFAGRNQFAAPDIDNRVLFKAKFVDVGNFYDVKICGTKDLDLTGEIV